VRVGCKRACRFRLFLHVLAATIWVGGQITLAALVPVLRQAGTEIPRAAAHRFNQIAWPAFGVLVVTGVWNVIAVRSQINGSYEITLLLKLIAVAAQPNGTKPGTGVNAHVRRGRSPGGRC
jgi:putative copper export protein